jgi:hypothetical protein
VGDEFRLMARFSAFIFFVKGFGRREVISLSNNTLYITQYYPYNVKRLPLISTPSQYEATPQYSV